jgi:hypothetical protein
METKLFSKRAGSAERYPLGKKKRKENRKEKKKGKRGTTGNSCFRRDVN